jgi:hypothetical protein
MRDVILTPSVRDFDDTLAALPQAPASEASGG